MTTPTMPTGAKPPEECETMAEVRVGVDTLDRELMRLIAVRYGYMRAAARIKPERGHVRDEARKAQVIANVREDAVRQDLPADELAAIWDSLVESSIAYEMVEWDRIRAAAEPSGEA